MYKDLLEIQKQMKKTSFMEESNKIEREDRLNPWDLKALDFACLGILGLWDILGIHSILWKYLKKSRVGSFRKVNVTVWPYIPPNHEQVLPLMEEYMKEFHNMDSREAHNRFEAIHPFQDLNWRVGRLIWLSKAINEGYNYSIPFLQMYYYQTLNHFETKI